jgi:hypothetical protein
VVKYLFLCVELIQTAAVWKPGGDMHMPCVVGRYIPYYLDISPIIYSSPVTVAVRSEAWVLVGWLLGSWVLIPLKAWMFVRVFLCCYPV